MAEADRNKRARRMALQPKRQWNGIPICVTQMDDKMATRCQQQCENIFVALFLDDKMGYMWIVKLLCQLIKYSALPWMTVCVCLCGNMMFKYYCVESPIGSRLMELISRNRVAIFNMQCLSRCDWFRDLNVWTNKRRPQVTIGEILFDSTRFSI